MANKHQVLELMERNPNWDSIQIANRLECGSEYVRATARRAGKSFRRPSPGSAVYALGRAAMEVGLTVERIEALARAGLTKNRESRTR